MAGLIALAVLAAWIWLVGQIAKLLTKRWQSQPFRRRVYVLMVFALILPLPVVDEIIGRYQFLALCEEGARPRYDEVKLRGRTVNLRKVPHPEVPGVLEIPNRVVPAAIRIIELTIDWLDRHTGEPLLSYRRYEAKGGWLMRWLGLEGGAMFLEPDACDFNVIPLFKRLDVNFQQTGP